MDATELTRPFDVITALRRSVEPRDVLTTSQFIRAFEERVLDLRREETILGSVHPCIGQEIVPAVVVGHLDQRDKVLATYRGHGWALACGAPAAGVMAELMGRASGTNGGRGGSAYLSAPDVGFVGENSIVAAGLPIANGFGMGLAAAGDGGIVVVSFGDGATNQGAAHEAWVLATARRLPVLFVCENNGWSEMTPIESVVPVGLAQRAAAYGMAAATVDASDFDELVVGAGRAVDHVRSGAGPYFLEVLVPRLLGHYNADIEHYRSQEDKDEHRARDPLAALEARLVGDGAMSPADLVVVREQVRSSVAAAVASATAAPPADTGSVREHVVADAPARDTAASAEGVVKELRYGLAVNRALRTEMATRPSMITFGEDIAVAGGTFGVTRNLQREFGEHRVFDTPIAEAAILGAAVGASQQGLLPVVEIMWSDFVLVALDQLVNQAANVRYLSNGRVSAPMVVRMQQGVTPGSCAQHSQSLEALLAHVPGLKVGLPSNAQDAYAMTRAAIADPDPVILIESRALYLTAGPVEVDAAVEPVGGARQVHDGDDVVVVSWGRMAAVAARSVEALEERGVHATLLDLRWLSPLDEEAVVTAARRCGGRVLVVHEANLTGGFGAEVVARLAERADEIPGLKVCRLALPDVRVPAAPALQAALLPSEDSIVDAAFGLVGRTLSA